MGSFPLVAHPIFHLIETSDIYRYNPFNNDENHTPLDESYNIEFFNDQERLYDWLKFYCVRTAVILVIYLLSILIPNISILITFLGALLGTIINVWIPVLFYNRAYNNTEKNKALAKMDSLKREALISSGVMILSDPNDLNSEPIDGRIGIKLLSWIMFVVGTFVGLYSFIYVIIVFSE
jgi:hypothetical protein